MLRTERLARKAAIRRPVVHRAGADMALASTVVFFGVFPAVMGAGFVLVQVLTVLAH